jgi:hypothetical protein
VIRAGELKTGTILEAARHPAISRAGDARYDLETAYTAGYATLVGSRTPTA